MTTSDIIKLAREAGIEWQENSSMSGKKRMSTAGSQSIERIEHFATLATQAERESRQAAQAENEQLKARLARAGVELRKAVRDEREALKMRLVEYANNLEKEGEDPRTIRAFACIVAMKDLADEAAIRARNHSEDKLDMVPGLALESGEFVPAESIPDWSAA